MRTVNMVKKQLDVEKTDASLNALFSKLDEAIDDLENGRVLSEEEVWAEIDAM